jgi:hypothetical protein
MDKKKAILKEAALISFIPVSGIFYGLLNSGDRGANSLVTDIDRAIPFIKVFIIPYVAWYPFIFITFIYFFYRDKDCYYQTLISLYIGVIFSYGVYVIYQTTVPRPVLIGDDILTRMVEMVYASDRPFNCFPSIHCLSSYLVFKGVGKCRFKEAGINIIISCIAFSIILATLFIKQHAVLDALAAIVLGEAIFNALSSTIFREKVLKYSRVKNNSEILTSNKSYESQVSGN